MGTIKKEEDHGKSSKKFFLVHGWSSDFRDNQPFDLWVSFDVAQNLTLGSYESLTLIGGINGTQTNQT